LAETNNARDKIGFEAQISLEEGLRRLVAWWQSSRLATEAVKA
jgi:UDP-glucose 4-epimerase